MAKDKKTPEMEPALQRAEREHGAMLARFWGVIGLLVAAVFLLNAIMVVLGERTQMSVDLTANAAYRLDDETKRFLQGLDKDVDIYVLAGQDDFTGAPYLVQALHILEQYPLYSARVGLTFVDYVADPTFAARFPELKLDVGNVLVTGPDGTKQLALRDLYNFVPSVDGSSLVIGSSRAEEAVTGAMMSVTSGRQVRVAVLSGNGVKNEEAFTQLLVSNNFSLAPVNLQTEELGAAYDIALLLAPQTDYTANELEKLDAFLYNNGEYGKTLFYTADVTQQPLPNLETFLREWGVAVADGAVFETVADRTYQYQPFYPVANYAEETYKGKLIDAGSFYLLPRSRPLQVLFGTKDSNETTVLLEFAASTGVRPSDAPDTFTGDDATVHGPMPAMVLASKRILKDGITQARSNLVVSASTAMLEDFCIQSTSLTNSEYLLNLLNDLVDRGEVVNIAPKSLAGRNLSVSSSTATVLGVVLAGVVPVGLLVFGIVVWLRRRYR